MSVMDTHQTRQRGLWLLRISPWASFAVVAVSVVVSVFLPELKGIAVLGLATPVLLFLPDSVGWRLVAAFDPAMPEDVRPAAEMLRRSLLFFWGAVLLGPVLFLIGWMVDLSGVFGGVLVLGVAFSAVALLSMALARSANVAWFLEDVGDVMDTPALLGRLRNFHAALVFGVAGFSVLAIGRSGSEEIWLRAAVSAMMLLIPLWVAWRGSRMAVLLSALLASGWDGGCSACGYDVSGLRGTVCPECGTAVPPRGAIAHGEVHHPDG